MKERLSKKSRVYIPPRGKWNAWKEIKWRWFRFTKGCRLMLRGIFQCK